MSTHLSKRLAAMSAVIPFAALLIVGGAAPAIASQPVDGTHKVAYCHATHSKTNPFVYIETDKVAVIRAHERHQNDEDVIPAFSYEWKGEAGHFPGQGDTSMIGDGNCDGAGEVG